MPTESSAARLPVADGDIVGAALQRELDRASAEGRWADVAKLARELDARTTENPRRAHRHRIEEGALMTAKKDGGPEDLPPSNGTVIVHRSVSMSDEDRPFASYTLDSPRVRASKIAQAAQKMTVTRYLNAAREDAGVSREGFYEPGAGKRIIAHAAEAVAAMPPLDVHRSRLLDLLEQRQDRLEDWANSSYGDPFGSLQYRLAREAEALGVDHDMIAQASELLHYADEAFSQAIYGNCDVDDAESRFRRATMLLRGGNEQNWTGTALREVFDAVERHVDGLKERLNGSFDMPKWEGPTRSRPPNGEDGWHKPDKLDFVHMLLRREIDLELDDVERALGLVGEDTSRENVERVHAEIASWPIDRETPQERYGARLQTDLVNRWGSAFEEPLASVADMLDRVVQGKRPEHLIVVDLIWNARQRATVNGVLDKKAYRFPFVGVRTDLNQRAITERNRRQSRE